MKRLRGCLLIIVVGLVLYMFATSGNKSSQEALPTLAVLPSLTWTGEAVAIQATEPPGVTIIPTVIIRSGFVTITPAPGTIYPTATITNTPSPVPTNTDLPTEPPATATFPVQAINSEIYYTTRDSNVRKCPSTDCANLGTLNKGTSIVVTGSTVGQEVTTGITLWYQVQYGGQTAYIYSPSLTKDAPIQIVAPTAIPQQVIAPVPATVAPASSGTIICKDGYVWPGFTRQGACHDHGGIRK